MKNVTIVTASLSRAFSPECTYTSRYVSTQIFPWPTPPLTYLLADLLPEPHDVLIKRLTVNRDLVRLQN